MAKDVAKSPWHSVRDMLPRPGVLVIVASRCTSTGCCHTGIAWRFTAGGWGTRQDNVDLSGIEFWSPLPEPPKCMTEERVQCKG